jgi:hypothetical protein
MYHSIYESSDDSPDDNGEGDAAAPTGDDSSS